MPKNIRINLSHTMTLGTSCNGTDLDLHQKILAANNLTLAHIARSAPLAETLGCIVSGIEDQFPGILGAVLLLHDEHMNLLVAPGLPQEYHRAIGEASSEIGNWARQLAADALTEAAADNAETSKPCLSFFETALQHGLNVRSAIPIRSGTNSLLGVFVAYSKTTDRPCDTHRQAIVNVVPLAVIAIERNIAEARIKQAETALREREIRMELAIEGSGTGIWDRDIPSGEIHYSPGWKAICGYAESDISNRIEESYTRVHPDDLPAVRQAMQAHFDQHTESYAVEHRVRCKDGSYKWISSRGKVVRRDTDGKPLRMTGTTTDISAMRALSDRLQQNVDLITSLTNEVPGLVYQYRLLPNGEAFYSYVSEGIRDIYELAPEHVAENPSLINEIIHPEDFANYRASLEASAASMMPWHLEYRVILPKQGLRWRHGNARPSRLEDGSTLWHGFITDVTERKRAEIELQGFATIDFLTQLPNRRYFMVRMDEELARVQRVADTRTAILMCDIDHFKNVNDTYGHAVGDMVLRYFANILRAALRKEDTVGRVGGEEFAAVLADAGVDEANSFAMRVQALIAETPFVEGNKTISVTASIGITVMSAKDASIATSLSRSDEALYRAKANGRNRIEIVVD